MFTCPTCGNVYLVGQGWIPPPCIFSSANDLFQLPGIQKRYFSHIVCECGQFVGVKILAGFKKQIGFWRIQFELELDEGKAQPKFFYPQNDITPQTRKFILEKQFAKNMIQVALDVKKNKQILYKVQRIVRAVNKIQKKRMGFQNPVK